MVIGRSLFEVLMCASDRESGGQGKRLKTEQNLEIPVLMAEQSTDLTPEGAEASALKSSSRLSPGGHSSGQLWVVRAGALS